jgi:hypothetical protein
MGSADARLAAARAAIAHVCLEALPGEMLGEIRLADHQRAIVARARRAIERDGGCLVADDVGRGKTFVALALAQRWRRPLVLVPAALRATWEVASQRSGVPCAIESHEGLSMGRMPSVDFDGIVVDESHHFRTADTRRYSALCRLSAQVPLVLLSATPLQNRTRDLAAQLALYLGERAFTFDVQALSRFVIRGGDEPAPDMPAVRAPSWLTVDADDAAVLDAILALAPPARPLDAGDAGALRTIGLARAWASSRAALAATVRTRRRIATAIEQGVEAGRTPTRREVRAWHGCEDVVQLGFASLLIGQATLGDDLTRLREVLEQEHASLGRLASVLSAVRDPDVERVAAIRRLRAMHPTSRILAFSEYASTVRAFFGAMRADSGVGMLTARDARIASGRVSRQELLVRFAPRAQRAADVPLREQVTLLLATDLLSEGVNLQDANVVLHLDLPWNPARLAQRVGRVRRPGGGGEVWTYLLAPPASAAALLDADARLRRKLKTADGAIGGGFAVLPVPDADHAAGALSAGGAGERTSLTSHRPGEGLLVNASSDGALHSRLARWRCEPNAASSRRSTCITAAVCAPVAGWLAALRDGRLVGAIDGAPPDTRRTALRLSELAEGAARDAHPREVEEARASVLRWLAAEELASACGLDESAMGPMRRAVHARLTVVARALPRHRRAEAFPLVNRLRELLRYPLPLGLERMLAEHAARQRAGDEDQFEWLVQALRIVGDRTLRDDPTLNGESSDTIAALIVFGPRGRMSKTFGLSERARSRA